MADLALLDSPIIQLSGTERTDAFASAVTGVGHRLQDKAETAMFEYRPLSEQLLEDLWAQDDMAARIVETHAQMMLREGFDVLVTPDSDKPDPASADASAAQDIADAMAGKLDELGVANVLMEALETEDAMGGAAILLGVEDGSANPAEPLREESLRALDWFNVLSCVDLRPVRWYSDPTQESYGKPELYMLTRNVRSNFLVQLVPTYTGRGERLPDQAGVIIHESRLIRLPGIKLPRRLADLRFGWGGSKLERCFSVIRDFQMSWKAAATLLQDFSQAILKIKGLATKILGGDNSVIQNRALMFAFTKSVARMGVIDSEEEFQRIATPLSGMPEMLQQMSTRLAAAARMPATVLMGTSPAGLNATGESDIRNFYDEIKVEQQRRAKPALDRIVRLLFLAKEGPTQGKEPKNWLIRFRPLWQMSDTEKADVRLKMAQADAAYAAMGAVSPFEVAESRWGGTEYSLDTKLDLSARAALEASDVTELAPGVTPDPVDPSQQATPAVGTAGGPDLSNPNAVDPRTALNGAQVTSMVEIITLVASGQIPRDTGIELLTAAFPISRPQAEKIMGSVGKGFVPEKPPAPPAPPAGAQPPPAPLKPNQPPATRLNAKDDSEG